MAERKILAYIFSRAERKDFIPRKRASHGFLIRQEKKKKDSEVTRFPAISAHEKGDKSV